MNTTPINTMMPTMEPAMFPTMQPTMMPTMEPTMFPTMEPTMMPTMEPAMFPTMEPTMFPTMEPTMMPIMQPTMMPTMMPTMEPTMMPTMMPTMQPTMMPTMMPTMQQGYTYKIERWDAILSPNGLNKQPMIYILPDIKFIELMNKHKQVLSVSVNNTNTQYDGQVLYGTVSRSSFIPNFFSKTHLYTIILDCEWYGYPNPSFLGTATFGSPV